MIAKLCTLITDKTIFREISLIFLLINFITYISVLLISEKHVTAQQLPLMVSLFVVVHPCNHPTKPNNTKRIHNLLQSSYLL